MPKWSDYIRNLGTAGPATLEGIYNLGFALRSEIPALFNKYLRVDAAQAFTGPEKTQGQANLGLGSMATQSSGAVDISGGTIAGITDLAIADGGTGASTAPAARTNLGLGNVDNTSDANKPVSTAQLTALNLKAPLASPALTGNPTGPTPAVGDNDTSLATTAFVHAEIPNQLNAAGAAPIFACRAWLRYNGITGVVLASGNVASVTKNGTGDYTINFTTAMADANYSAVVTGENQLGAFANVLIPINYHTYAAGSLRIWTLSSAGAALDYETVNLAIFR